MSKYLMSADFVALRKGEFVEADESVGEFIFDSDNSCGQFTKGHMEEMAKANKIKIAGNTKRDDYCVALATELAKLKLPEINKMTDSQTVAQIVEKGFAENKSDEEMIIEIIQSGVKFKQAGRMFKQAVEDGGFRVSAKDLREQVFEKLDALEFNPEHYDEVVAVVDHLQNEIEAEVEDAQVLSMVRRWSKTNEIELPKKPKAEKVGKVLGFGGFGAVVVKHMLNNNDITKDDLKEFVTKKKPDYEVERIERVVEKFYKFIEFSKLVNSEEN